MARNGKVETTAMDMKSKSAQNRRGAGVKNVQSSRRNKGEQRATVSSSVLKGPTPVS